METIVDGLKTFYVDEGRREGTPVVLVHGMTLDHQMWRPQIAALSPEYRVIAYDVRGHGRTEVGDGQFTYRRLAMDLGVLLDNLGLRSVVLCGFSMGGMIAFRALELFPERFRALVFCDTSAHADSDPSRRWREQMIETIGREGMAPYMKPFIEKCFCPRSFETRKEEIEATRRVVLAQSPRGARGILLAQAGRVDSHATLAQVRVPTLIMVGEEDAFTPPDLSREMHGKTPGSEMFVVPGAGHMTPLENPEAVNGRLLEFLARLPAPV